VSGNLRAGVVYQLVKMIKNRISRILDRRKNDRYILGDSDRPIANNRVNVIYWKKKGRDNVGDLLSKVIVEKVAEYNGLKLDEDVKTCQLLGIGSIIQEVKSPSTVWGSGIRERRCRLPRVNLDIRAVRGPLTRDVLIMNGISCPEVYGDPAILCPSLILDCKDRKKNIPYTVIPHFSKEENYTKYRESCISTITSDWRAFIEKIAESHLVISGSLHGIILAEAYGVPALLLDDCDDDKFKYMDYYNSTNRKELICYDSVESALAAEIPSIPDMSLMASTLLEHFPADLWTNK